MKPVAIATGFTGAEAQLVLVTLNTTNLAGPFLKINDPAFRTGNGMKGAHCMGKKAPPSGMRLTPEDVALVKGMLRRGDRQQDIASYFGVNSARIAEVSTGEVRPEIVAAADNELPPPGPYMSGRNTETLRKCLASARAALASAQQALDHLSK